ncbi:tRNA pseudouridine(13) synthase TruD [Vibrio parahaemolyticus]|uniref:tRNA pseudouridine synthase D n=1 Tax=Vibrio parahaemolyticus TaxID=670 RepID=A0A7Y0X8W6_VIBPH|nr:tRNA pseudouridine(13) synthase TruD [Vibrio parahaemolyticus]EHC7290725.1 tRNA pseudouridine(13) synthase TruD [Vibrio parahaemolyticus]EJE4149729.1 tRNA pseudouridine(13) synthase TruD [Vibrio parahaemolyticus]ELA7271729.1 tRNA pseudouridine(13) synthase TruD [Vibrio parahaemolyticus]ELA7279323.1 tRNA pseudouridine(13) synthase TruD [Vibrio parahaemolyticus]ELA7340908.1 tRNA pseudouridine(13) synthase TruD [Vibrio parahaemolyticus]
MSDILSPLAYLTGKPVASAKIKAQPEHFQVREDLGFSFTGEGEHLMVRIRKTGENTSFVANELAKACGVKSKDVSWAGLKDRHAVTEQWLSVHLPKGETPDFSTFLAQYPSIEILATDRHNKKLRPGDLIGNEFVVTLSEVTDVADVEQRLEKVKQVGVPNYFGSQRFGNDGNNLDEARRWGRENVRTRNQNKRSMYLSAARSWIFNRIVSARLENGVFDKFIDGDIAQTSQGLLAVDANNLADMQNKLALSEVEITAALAGDNALPTQADALALEQPFIDEEPDLMALIRGNRMRHDRREIALKPKDLAWNVEGNNITLTFSLDAGSFATSIVRELVNEVKVEREY